jgi:hypothetical protein
MNPDLEMSIPGWRDRSKERLDHRCLEPVPDRWPGIRKHSEAHVRTKRGSDALEDFEADTGIAVLDLGHVRPVDPRDRRNRRLGQTRVLAEVTEVLSGRSSRHCGGPVGRHLKLGSHRRSEAFAAQPPVTRWRDHQTRIPGSTPHREPIRPAAGTTSPGCWLASRMSGRIPRNSGPLGPVRGPGPGSRPRRAPRPRLQQSPEQVSPWRPPPAAIRRATGPAARPDAERRHGCATARQAPAAATGRGRSSRRPSSPG